jgi:NAD+ synthase (glutamine-hydrolysing)
LLDPGSMRCHHPAQPRAHALDPNGWREKSEGNCSRRGVALACINRQASTPELRPHEAAQQSEGDLMPFPVLDRIERLAIRDKLPPKRVLPQVAVDFPQYRADDLRRWVERFFTLWCRNQWKRERFAPAFHLDDENLDPKTWCRFPILSGGFRRELQEMAEG